MNSFGWNIRLSLFGEPQSSVAGVILDGLPVGEEISQQLIAEELAKQPPGLSETGIPAEAETPAICSGLSDEKTIGTPLCILLRGGTEPNLSSPPNVLRPGYPDYVSMIRSRSTALSGELLYNGKVSSALIAAGAVCKQILGRRGVSVKSKITQIGPYKGDDLSYDMRKEILDVRASGDSVGGVVCCTAEHVAAGLGGLVFAGLESSISAMLFAIPGVRGVEFGDGFSIAELRGSAANDPYSIEEGRIVTESNHAGGVIGGISNGNAIVLRCAFSPAPLIGREQRSVDIGRLENTSLRIRGRVEPCSVPKAALAVEAVVAFCVLDAVCG